MKNSRFYFHFASVCSGIFIILFFFYEWTFNSVVPPNDFPGGASLIWSLGELIKQEGTIPLWNPWWFNGCSNMLLISQSASLFPLLVLAHIFGVVQGLKAGVTIFMILSFLGMYLFCFKIIKKILPSLAGALVYALFPLQISSGITTGHIVVSMFFALIPISFLIFEHHFCRPSPKGAAAVALITALIMTFENEKGLILCTILAVWVIVRGRIKPFAAPFFLSLGLTAFYTLPIAQELGYYRLFPRDTIGLEKIQFASPPALSFFDRFSQLVLNIPGSLSAQMQNFSGYHYLGMAAISAACLGLIWALVLRVFKKTASDVNSCDNAAVNSCDNADLNPCEKAVENHFFYIFFVSGLFFTSLALAQGPFSFFSRNMEFFLRAHKIFEALFANSPLFGFALLTCMIIIILTGLIISISAFKSLYYNFSLKKLSGLLFFVFFIFIPLEPLFIKVFPLFANMRSPMWYFTVSAGFCTAFLSASFLAFTSDCRPIVRRLAFFLFLVIHFTDIYPYVTYTTRADVSPAVSGVLSRAMEWIKKDSADQTAGQSNDKGTGQSNDKGTGQPSDQAFEQFCKQKNYILPGLLTLDSYSPVEDMGMIVSQRKVSWYWLNWIAPKWSHQMVYDLVLPILYSGSITPVSGQLISFWLSLSNSPYLLEKSGQFPDYDNIHGFDYKCSVNVTGAPGTEDRSFYRIFKSTRECANLRVYKNMVLFGGSIKNSANLLLAAGQSGFVIINAGNKKISSFSRSFLNRFSHIVWEKRLFNQDTPDKRIEYKEFLQHRLKICDEEDIFDKTDFYFKPLQGRGLKNRAEYIRISAGRIRVNIKTDFPVILALSESYHPLWKVRINNRLVKPLRVNNSFLGLSVGAGDHEIDFTFLLRLHNLAGIFISLVSFIIALVMIFKKQDSNTKLSKEGILNY